MKTVYIPKGETVHYESLVTEHLVVHGHLHVTYGIKAKTITGKGVINAGTIDADTVCIDDVEAASVICKRLIAKRAQAPEIFASESAAVSCFLSAAYVETGKLTVIWNPELRADIIYRDTEYQDFPIPRLVFGLRILENGKVAECSMGVVADEKPTEDRLAYSDCQ